MTGSPKKICVVTGSRAEYGYLYWVMKELKARPEAQLLTVVTGSHLSDRHGLTFREIEKDGFTIDAKVPIHLEDDSAAGIAETMSATLLNFGRYFAANKPDWVVVIGDRFEILAVVTAAMLNQIPIAHLGGGDTTEGAMDESIRHCISKMAHLHFVSNSDAAKRLLQMGEDPVHVFNVGSTAIDTIMRREPLERDDFFSAIEFKPGAKNVLVTYHPETLATISPKAQVHELIEALNNLGEDYSIIWTRPNVDPGNVEINEMIDQYVRGNHRAKAYASLGSTLYLNAIRHVDIVVGNSSSGLYEVPSFKKPTVNIGGRQQGRILADSVLSCPCRAADIVNAIKEGLQRDCSRVVNPYGDGMASKRIADIILGIQDKQSFIRKTFHPLEAQ